MKSNKKIISIVLGGSIFAFLSHSAFSHDTTYYVKKDAGITQAVKTQLLRDPSTQALGIQISTHEGVVTVSGNVATENQADAVIQNAESINGVRDVKSRLIVAGSQQTLTDTMITAKIKGQFLKNKIFGNQPIALIGVKVETQNGVVYLSGYADNKSQIKNAIKSSYSINGVRKVVNNIQIKKSTHL